LAQVITLSSKNPWSGVTYREDKLMVKQFIADPVSTDGYTANLGMEETAQ
jgi:hypothetical protein